MSGKRGTGSRGRKARAIASTTRSVASPSTMRSSQGEGAERSVSEMQRMAPIFGQSHRAITESQEQEIVEMMAGQQPYTTGSGSRQTTSFTSTPVSNRRPPPLEVTTTPAASSNPALDVCSLKISPVSASTLRAVQKK